MLFCGDAGYCLRICKEYEYVLTGDSLSLMNESGIAKMNVVSRNGSQAPKVDGDVRKYKTSDTVEMMENVLTLDCLHDIENIAYVDADLT